MSVIADTICPHCGHTNDEHSATTGKPYPTDGDVSLCWQCHGLAMYTIGPYGIALRMPTPEEMTAINADPRVKTVIAAAKLAKAQSDGP
jgi:hypothetical protein